MAIMEYLDETHPTPAIMPADALGRASARCRKPLLAKFTLNNLRILKYLVNELKVSEEIKHMVRTVDAHGFRSV